MKSWMSPDEDLFGFPVNKPLETLGHGLFLIRSGWDYNPGPWSFGFEDTEPGCENSTCWQRHLISDGD